MSSLQSQSYKETYDVIVVGSGLAGLTAAALLAKQGKNVLVAERHTRPGGYAQAFKRKDYLFDAAVHLIHGCSSVGLTRGGLVNWLLNTLGIRQKCTFLQADPIYTAIFPGVQLNISTGVEEFIQTHIQLFPEEEKGLRKLMNLCVQLNQEINNLAFSTSPLSTKNYPMFLNYGRATLGEVMDSCLTNPKLKALFSTLWIYMGLPPATASFLGWATMLIGYIEHGAYYCKGSFRNLVNALIEGLNNYGGELLLGHGVSKIVINNQKVIGVILNNGQYIHSPVVVSNADAKQTFEKLIGIEHLPEFFLKKLRHFKPSLSAFIVYLATDLNINQSNVGFETFLYNSWDHNKTYQQILQGIPSGILITVPTLIDSNLGPIDEHLITISTLMPYQNKAFWKQQKAYYTQQLLEKASEILPMISEHIKVIESASPETLKRYTSNTDGALFGWELSPSHMGTSRLGIQTPVEGCYLSGHWTQPRGSVYGVILSGIQTAKTILNYSSVTNF